MIEKLREEMIRHELDLLIVVSSDEHLNEYLPVQNWRLKASTVTESSSGFSGSAGTVVFCIEGRPQLFVDSRYHLQNEGKHQRAAPNVSPTSPTGHFFIKRFVYQVVASGSVVEPCE